MEFYKAHITWFLNDLTSICKELFWTDLKWLFQQIEIDI